MPQPRRDLRLSEEALLSLIVSTGEPLSNILSATVDRFGGGLRGIHDGPSAASKHGLKLVAFIDDVTDGPVMRV